ncbi:MAG: hypothetical protein PHV37_02510 [Candidatus Gastranaerophilales bacterium]|nr:hypothetical protein [Candidatus Gastranaerophilales bacterium]
MYLVYVDKPSSFSPDLLGEYSDLEEAQKVAKQAKIDDPEISYSIEESNGGFNSYGDLLTSVIEKG